jgi:hypothetical protein
VTGPVTARDSCTGLGDGAAQVGRTRPSRQCDPGRARRRSGKPGPGSRESRPGAPLDLSMRRRGRAAPARAHGAAELDNRIDDHTDGRVCGRAGRWSVAGRGRGERSRCGTRSRGRRFLREYRLRGVRGAKLAAPACGRLSRASPCDRAVASAAAGYGNTADSAVRLVHRVDARTNRAGGGGVDEHRARPAESHRAVVRKAGGLTRGVRPQRCRWPARRASGASRGAAGRRCRE